MTPNYLSCYFKDLAEKWGNEFLVLHYSFMIIQIVDDFEFTRYVFRLALKAFTDQKRRFFPHLEDEVLSHLHDGEPGVSKKPRLSASNGELEEESLSEILKNLENEVPNMKIFTYRHLDWSKRASSLASLMDDDFVDPSKELNLQNMGKSRSSALTTSIDQVAVIELLVPSIFRAIVSLHPAGSTDPDAVAFFSPTEVMISSKS